jgi:RNA polymerase sigma factor (sigma-70 family)
MVSILDKKLADNELLYLIQEKNEEAGDLLFERYKHIIDISVNKYLRSAYALNVDIEELKQEAMLGYVDAIHSYNDNMNMKLSSFISLCVERRLQNIIRKNNTGKIKMLKEAYSLDNEIGEDLTLADVVGDNRNNPEVIKEEKESVKKLREKIDSALSNSEKEVLELILNDYSSEEIASILGVDIKRVYNATARIRMKLKELI